MRILAILLGLMFCSGGVTAQSISSAQGLLKVQVMASDLSEPWGLAFLPDGGFLVTLRGGQLRAYGSDGRFLKVKGVPKVAAKGQGGLLDVVVARDFAQSREIFLSFAKPGSGGAATALAVARLSENRRQLQNLRIIFEMNARSGSRKHFGSRIVEALDGTLFLTIGERGDRPLALDLSVHNGKVVRINRDGSVPASNPLAAGSAPEIWSYGHRNPQGAALDLKGQLWVVEHGARGGDEINRIRKGRNYGWPVIAYGRHYSGGKIGEGTHKAGMEQPDYYWDPSIAPSGMMIYSGRMWPAWKDDFFVGSLKFDHIARLKLTDGALRQVEILASDQTGRVRDIREAPDGAIWFLSVDSGAVFRISK